MAGPFDILIAPRLVLRALDDLHTIATVVDRAADRLESLDGHAEALERLGTQIVALGERLDSRGEEMLEFGDSMQELGRELHAQATVMDAHAERVEAVGSEIVASLPTLQQAVSLVSPLEGAVERIGRVVDRLPGGEARRAAPRRLPGESPEPAPEEPGRGPAP